MRRDSRIGSINEAEPYLRPTFDALDTLRTAYRTEQHPKNCHFRLQQACGLLTSSLVRDFVAQPLRRVDGSRRITPEKRKQLLAKESQLVKRVSGQRDHRILRRALGLVSDTEPAEWCRSSDDLAAYLEDRHRKLCASYVNTPAWRISPRLHNSGLMRRADHTVLAVVIVLVDVLDRAYLAESYRIGASLARDASLP
ncbi:hypothetical protein [Nocardia nepalensis]|uniref:hypothetical protein n=1 Tax=Nocardia nepalensis TaxID=3375448 RepID=UPI003B67CCC1